ncbi:hypothetical protein TSOC_005618 [Tetrabaena socialis]|uniref:Ankyrin repeat domain-containing protein n=1 Tax=Tetrabaena socialis TaxID=47790 RepID=A0A2J8A5V5_9CHLO|nr:hypothetical protein TSOC_005618 [Tetrabaena socialis]|eukprot:PNH07887.1 hypothetical protein TSOC_005618 [Tetrabaena socialis]
MALMVWLQEHGCPWDKYTFATAAEHGSGEQLEWLAEQGCPVVCSVWTVGKATMPSAPASGGGRVVLPHFTSTAAGAASAAGGAGGWLDPWLVPLCSFALRFLDVHTHVAGWALCLPLAVLAGSQYGLGALFDASHVGDSVPMLTSSAEAMPTNDSTSPSECACGRSLYLQLSSDPGHMAANKLQPACSPAGPPPQQWQADTARSSHDPSRIWLPEIVQRFAASLSPNEVAGTLRLVNKAAAVQFRGPQHTAVHLSHPVPHHTFVWRWTGPGGMRHLTVRDRWALLQLTARSGSIANLEVLLARDDLGLNTHHKRDSLFASVVEAGQLDVCTWLWHQGWPLGAELLDASARGGQQALYEWLLANGCPKGNEMEAAAHAANGGHVSMMDWILLGATTPGETPLDESTAFLKAAAAGCDLPTLQRLYNTYLDSLGRELLDQWRQIEVLLAAAKSPTADWRAKVEWLEAQGYPLTEDACEEAAGMPDALPRLQWLWQRGYPLGQTVQTAAQAGNVEALQYVLAQGGVDYGDHTLMDRAIEGGNVAVMEVMHAHGVPAGGCASMIAAVNANLPAVAWLVEKLGANTALEALVFQHAVEAGSMALMVWLQEHGCPWDEDVFTEAAEHGSEEQLEWLAEQGCPMGYDGSLYMVAAWNGNLANLHCLRRLGCPWSHDGSTFTSILKWLERDLLEDIVRRMLCWLLDQGCPVDWDQAEATAKEQGKEELLEWLRTQRRQRA